MRANQSWENGEFHSREEFDSAQNSTQDPWRGIVAALRRRIKNHGDFVSSVAHERERQQWANEH